MTFLNFELIFFDYVVLILTAVIVIFSFWKGFINSILGLLTWVGSVFVTIYSYQYLSDFLSKQLLNINFLQRFEQFVSVISIIISIPIIFLFIINMHSTYSIIYDFGNEINDSIITKPASDITSL